MQRFYANMLGRRPALSSPMPKAEALREAKARLRQLKRGEVLAVTAELLGSDQELLLQKRNSLRDPSFFSASEGV